jgi:uncharacterized protein (DUF2141 family)
MRVAGILAASACALALSPAAALASEVDVVVSGVRNDRGKVLVAVCTREAFLGPGCRWSIAVPARPGVVDATVDGVPPGTYAIQVFHDENENLDLDRNFIGFPKEGLGFSNDAPMKYGPPSFEDAAIGIPTTGARATVTLRYY